MRTAAVFLAALLSFAAPAAQRDAATVTFLHFNDVYEITPVEAGKTGGLARLATFRDGLKAQHPELVTTLGGDFLSPSALSTARVNGEPLYGRQMVAVLNALGLDWATFGNHEFDLPEAIFRARLAESTFRFVSSNVTDKEGAPFPGTVPYAIVPVKIGGRTIRIGLLGLTIDSNRQPWVRYAPPLESARAAVAHLRGQCDLVVALTHVTLDTDIQLAEQVADIELILGGHEHENWVIQRGPYFTPIVKADANVRTAAVVTVRFPATGGRPEATARIQRIDDRIKDEPRVAREVARWIDLGFAGFRKEGFEPTEIVKVVDRPMRGTEAEVRSGSTQLTELIADAMRHEAGTGISVFNAGSIRIDDVLIPGPITQYDVIRVLPYGGKVLRATLTGDLLSRVLEIGRGNKGTGGFLQTAGIPETIDPSARYTVAIASFLLTGNERNLAFLTRQNPEVSDITELRDVRLAVIDELRKR